MRQSPCAPAPCSVPVPRPLPLTVPMPMAALTEGSPARGEELVVYDNMGAGMGSLIGFSEGREAANPFGKTKTPVDAYCACLIDQINV